MPILNSTCGCLSLQVGVVTCSAIMATLSVIILNLTLFSYRPIVNSGFSIARMLVLFFVAVLFLVALISFIGAFTESRNLILISLGLWLLLFVYWIILCVFSMITASTYLSNVCIKERCAPSLWMVQFEYPEHKRRDINSKQYKNKYSNKNYSLEFEVQTKYLKSDVTAKKDVYEHKEKKHNVDGMFSKSGWNLFGLTFLFLINGVYFVFNAINLWSYSDKLYYKYIKSDDENPNEVVKAICENNRSTIALEHEKFQNRLSKNDN